MQSMQHLNMQQQGFQQEGMQHVGMQQGMGQGNMDQQSLLQQAMMQQSGMQQPGMFQPNMQAMGMYQGAGFGMQQAAGLYGASAGASAAQTMSLPQLGGISAEMQEAYAAQAYGSQPQPSESAVFGGQQMGAGGADGPLKQGTVKHWFEDKGFGFIAAADGGDDVFVHRNTLEDGQALVQGTPVQYAVQWTASRNKWTVTRCLGAVNSLKMGGGDNPPPAAPSNTGVVKVWFEEKGFGFVTPASGGDDVFVHRNALKDGQTLMQGATVHYSAIWNPQKNKFTAQDLTGASPGSGMPAGGGMQKGGGFGKVSNSFDQNRFAPYGGGCGAQAF